jgi:type I restriction enzyme S subunit
MNAERLLAHFDRIADAPGAVPRLRQFILDLAVRGKLVEQDPNDEPASELLERIEAERAGLEKVGEIKRSESFEPVRTDEIPFAIPAAWELTRMGSIARKLGAGSTPLGGKSVYRSEGVPFLRSQNVYDDGLRLDEVALIARAVHDKMSGTHVQPHDILLNITGASIGRCALVPATFTEGNVSQHVAIVRLVVPAIREKW